MTLDAAARDQVTDWRPAPLDQDVAHNDHMESDREHASIYRLWPAASSESLDDAGILSAYEMPEPGPTLRVNFIASIDGAASIAEYSAGLGGPGDRRVFDLLRVQCDALVVGAGTLRHEGYGPMRLDERQRRLRRDQGRPSDPPLVVVSSGLRLDPSHPMLIEAPQRPMVLTHASSPLEQRRALSAVADLLIHGETEVDLAKAIADLADRGYRQLLSEGGPHLLGAMTGAGVVDEMCLTVAPKLAGPGAGRITAGPPSLVQGFALAHVLRSEADELMLRYVRPR
jgi:riboflavin biosynthesis pyrimidine reductase